MRANTKNGNAQDLFSFELAWSDPGASPAAAVLPIQKGDTLIFATDAFEAALPRPLTLWRSAKERRTEFSRIAAAEATRALLFRG